MWDDLKHLKDIGFNGDVFAVNHTALLHTRPIDHFGTIHHKTVEYVMKMRRLEHKLESHVYAHSVSPATCVDQHWPFAISGGTSGLLCTMIAVCLGYDDIALAGIPMDGTGKFYQSPHMQSEYGGNARWDYGCTSAIGTWQQVVLLSERFRKCVRSVSGRTKGILGGV